MIEFPSRKTIALLIYLKKGPNAMDKILSIQSIRWKATKTIITVYTDNRRIPVSLCILPDGKDMLTFTFLPLCIEHAKVRVTVL
jgi:hypothetical protein